MEAARGTTLVFVFSLLATAFTAFAVDTTKLRCQAVTIYNSSYPTAGLHVDFVQVLSRNSSNLDECIALCCRQGVEKCQFVWKYQSNCLAVACLDVTKCSPEFGTNQDTTYVSISFIPDLAPEGNTAPITEPTVTISSKAPEDKKQLPTINIIPTTPPAFLVTIKGENDVFGSDATLYASLTKQPSYTYGYLWEQLDGPYELTIPENTKKMITLQSLESGVYTIQLTVTRSDGETSLATHELVVHDKLTSNQLPKPLILPSTSVTLRLPSNSATFHVSQSTDDLGLRNLQFDWTLLKKPTLFKPKGLPWVGPKLELHDLIAGFYRIRLDVTNADGAKSSAEANVTVLSDQDLPPVAIARGPVVIQLPVNEAVLMGNYSSDDKGIVHYSWTQTSGAAVKLHDEHKAVLHVANLQEGLYTFTLTVTDTAGQSSSKDVDVQVEAASTSSLAVGGASYVSAGGNVSVFLPDTSATLYGTASPNIVSFQWTRIGGPANTNLQGTNTAHLTVSGLHLDGSKDPTVYQFNLTAWNEMSQPTTDTAFVFLYSNKTVSQPPSTSSLPPPPPNQSQGSVDDVTIILPDDSVTLSSGLVGQGAGQPVQYRWSRSDSSPAIGRVAHGSDSTPNLHLTDLTNGTYVFTVATTNAAGQGAERKVTLRVKENPLSRVLVQIVISVNAQTFTQADLMDVSAMLKAALSHADIVVQKVTDLPPNVMIEFYATNDAGTPLNATDVQSKLTENGASFSLSPQFLVLEVETKVCQNMCSGHGFCSPRTKKCVCTIFWVENPFKSRFGRKISNCDWSVFYIMLVVIGSTILVTCLLWLCCCCCIKSRNNARKRRIRYAILAHKDNEENLNMLPKGEYTPGYAQTSLMVSESGEEEEIVFDAVKAKKPSRKPGYGTTHPQSAPAQQRETIPNRSETKSV